MILRGLTLWRPWSASIVHGPKRVENRPWAPPLRFLDQGLWIAVHAGRTWDREGASFLALHWNIAQAVHASGRNVENRAHWPEKFRDEGVVGIARVARVIRFDDLTGREKAEHPMAFGPWCWFLDSVRSFEPIPLRGAQGLFTLPHDVEASLLPLCVPVTA